MTTGRTVKTVLLAAVAAGVILLTASDGAMADGDEKPFPVIDNEAYKHECSSCHALYQPGLLPERSWEKIMKDAGKHFGENLALDEKAAAEIVAYLKTNAAEKGVNEWAQKILASVGQATPARITETGYIKRKHRKITAEILRRPSIKSISNCGACHKTAAEGDYEEDNIKIPKK